MQKKYGFTLIELMIVVSIISLLAMIVVPNFGRYLAKAKRTEAYMQLSSIYSAQKAYWAEHGKYSSTLYGQDGIGWKPEGDHYYTYGFAGSAGSNYFSGKLNAQTAELSPAYANESKFLALAIGDIDGDGQPDILAVDQFNNITILKDDLA
jgi:prepilin-type N-terminal cleavage/methylation domain-containing protein